MILYRCFSITLLPVLPIHTNCSFTEPENINFYLFILNPLMIHHLHAKQEYSTVLGIAFGNATLAGIMKMTQITKIWKKGLLSEGCTPVY